MPHVLPDEIGGEPVDAVGDVIQVGEAPHLERVARGRVVVLADLVAVAGKAVHGEGLQPVCV